MPIRNPNCWHCCEMKKTPKISWFKQTSLMKTYWESWIAAIWQVQWMVMQHLAILFLLKDLVGRWWYPPKAVAACCLHSAADWGGCILVFWLELHILFGQLCSLWGWWPTTGRFSSWNFHSRKLIGKTTARMALYFSFGRSFFCAVAILQITMCNRKQHLRSYRWLCYAHLYMETWWPVKLVQKIFYWAFDTNWSTITNFGLSKC